jgi:hypothetical protein
MARLQCEVVRRTSNVIGVRESIAAMILRHTNDRVTREHYVKPAPIEAIAAMRKLSEAFSKVETPKLLTNAAQNDPHLLQPMNTERNANGSSKSEDDLNV